MTALKSNKTLANVPLKRTVPDSGNDSDARNPKRVRLDDVHATLTEEDLHALEKDTLIERIIALQKHVATLKPSTPTKVAPIFAPNPSPSSLTPEQLEVKVQHARKMMIAGLKSSM